MNSFYIHFYICVLIFHNLCCASRLEDCVCLICNCAWVSLSTPFWILVSLCLYSLRDMLSLSQALVVRSQAGLHCCCIIQTFGTFLLRMCIKSHRVLSNILWVVAKNHSQGMQVTTHIPPALMKTGGLTLK